METNTIFLAIIAFFSFAFVAAEVAAAFVIYKRRHVLIPRLRSILGITALSNNLDAGRAEHRVIERKLNYIGRHVKFEREQLRAMGILKDQTQQPERNVNERSSGVITFPQRRN